MSLAASILSTMTNQTVQTLNGISADSFENDGQRMEAVAAAYALVARLETPWDFVLRLAMGQVSRIPLLQRHYRSPIANSS